MQKVVGIGGIFFKALDPQALNSWYEKHLGVNSPPPTYDDPDWQQAAGPTVFGPMPFDGEHFKKPAQLYINFRVLDLDKMCQQLEDNGITVMKDPAEYPNGRFASLEDPEGNQIQLWEVKK